MVSSHLLMFGNMRSMQVTSYNVWLWILACAVSVLQAQDVRSSDVQQTPDLQAVTETLVQTYGPFRLESETLQQVQSAGQLPFQEDAWLTGYRVEMTDAGGQTLDRELMCHTFFGSRVPKHDIHDELRGIFSDGYTQGMRLPPGYGIFFEAGENAVWLPMFNNRNPEFANASMEVTLELVPARKVPGGLRELSTTFQSVQMPHLYYVPAKKQDVRESSFLLPFVGRIHAMGTHLHPYGVSVELINVTRNESVWKAVGKRNEEGRLVEMPVYSSTEGYRVETDDLFKIVATYDNPTEQPVDAMAGIFILYTTAR